MTAHSVLTMANDDPSCPDRNQNEKETQKETSLKLHVRFAKNDSNEEVVECMVRELLVPASEMTSEEKEEIWYNDLDYEGFEELNSLAVQQYILENASNPDSYTVMVDKVYNFCVSSTSTENKSHAFSLQHSMRDAFILRGLELWSIPMIAEKRRKRKEAQIRAVLHLQDRLNSEALDNYEKAQVIRTEAQNLSRPSTMFARYMASADAASIHEEIDAEEEDGASAPRRRSMIDRVKEKMRRRRSPSSRRSRRSSL